MSLPSCRLGASASRGACGDLIKGGGCAHQGEHTLPVDREAVSELRRRRPRPAARSSQARRAWASRIALRRCRTHSEAEPSNKMVFNDPSNVIAGPVARRPEGAETPRRVEVPFAASGPPILDIHSAAGGVERLCRPVCVSERSSCHRVSNVFGEDDVAMLHDRLLPAYGASALVFVLDAVSIKQRPPR